MKKCKKYNEWIWLDMYQELQPAEKQELTSHLESCAECRLDYAEAVETITSLNRKAQLDPTLAELENSRSELHQRLFIVKQSQLQRAGLINKFKMILSFDFAPQFRLAYVLVVLLIGVVLGKFVIQDSGGITSGEMLIADINNIKYDSESHKVVMKVKTFDERIVSGNINEPEIQALLAQAMITSERPNVRLNLVDMLYGAQKLDRETQAALVEVAETDDNPGMRLKAIRLLNTLPLNEQVQEMLFNSLIRVMLHEPNTAIRNEAIDGLTKVGQEEFAGLLLDAAKEDTSGYLQYKAANLQRIKLERKNN